VLPCLAPGAFFLLLCIANIPKVSFFLRKNDVEIFASMYTCRKTALRAYSYGVVAELHRASRTPRAIEIYIGIDPGESNF
jgi:hypothetical protein